MGNATEQRTIPALTGIRALAALLVLLLHASQSFPTAFASNGIVQKGYLGVDLFFLLSGFILTFVYFDQLREPTWRAFAVFIWHRFIRLYPVHITVLAALVIAVVAAGKIGLHLRSPETFTTDTLPSQILLLHAWGIDRHVSWNVPSWSISAEWFAYLCFPLVVLFLSRIRAPLALLFVAALSLGSSALIFMLANWQIATAWIAPSALVRIMGSFICGAAICRYAVLRGEIESDSKTKDLMALTALVAFFIAASVGLHDLLLVALLAIFIAMLGMSSGLAAKLFSLAPIAWLGETSYSLYMVHFPVLRALSVILKPDRLQAIGPIATFAAFWISIGVCIVCAASMFYFVERPLRARLRNAIGELPDANAAKPTRQLNKAV